MLNIFNRERLHVNKICASTYNFQWLILLYLIVDKTSDTFLLAPFKSQLQKACSFLPAMQISLAGEREKPTISHGMQSANSQYMREQSKNHKTQAKKQRLKNQKLT